jgi:RNA polymerase sigma-70 factor (ECF subfamily)
MIDRDVTIGLMLALERLTPPQRAAFLLHDMFDVPFAEVAEALDQSEETCRQHAARARAQVRAARKRFHVDYRDAERLRDAFLEAARRGDVEALKKLLADDVVFYSDGGGIRPAALHPIHGADRAARLFAGLSRKYGGDWPEPVWRGRINAEPGYVTLEPDGMPQATIIEARDGRITAIYIVRNPEKLHMFALKGTD